MPRHPSDQPTEVELEILNVLWQLGTSPLGEIHKAVAQRREVKYSTTRKMVQVMRDKGLIECDESVRPQLYSAARSQDQTQLGLLDNLVRRAFGGSTQKLVMSLLSSNRLSPAEFADLKKLVKKAKEAKP
jgi:predicted transcriptional regulator